MCSKCMPSYPRVWACGVVQRNQHGLWGYRDPGSNPPRPLPNPVGRVLDLCAFPLPHLTDGDSANCLIELTRKKDELEVENALALDSYLIKEATSSPFTHESSPVPMRIGFNPRVTVSEATPASFYLCLSLHLHLDVPVTLSHSFDPADQSLYCVIFLAFRFWPFSRFLCPQPGRLPRP